MNILSIVPKTAALLESLHAVKHPGHDDQSVHSGGGGASDGAGERDDHDGGQGRTADLENLMAFTGDVGGKVDAVYGMLQDEAARGEIDANHPDIERLEDAQFALDEAEMMAMQAEESWEAGDIANGDALLRDAQDRAGEGRSLLNRVVSSQGIPTEMLP